MQKGPRNSTPRTAFGPAPGRSMAWVKERAPILCKCRWGLRGVTLRWPRAQVIGIDVSVTIVLKAERQKRKHGNDNLGQLQLH